MKSLTTFCLILLVLVPLAAGGSFNLDYDRLQVGLNSLDDSDRGAVDGAIKLIKGGEHSLALARLSALNQHAPENSSLRILASYVLLQVGNLVGAFEEAEKAHQTPNSNVYTCWFLARVALLNGKTTICKRELEHVKKSGQMVAERKQLEKEMQKP